MTSKRKQVYLTIVEKYDILLMIERGVCRENIKKKYNISQRTVRRIYAQREKIKTQFKIGTVAFRRSTKRLTLRRSAVVDTALIHWYLRCKERNINVTGLHMRRKALEINEKLNGYPGFRASDSWLINFKKRYRITSANIGEDLLIVDEFADAKNFPDKFNKLLQEEGISLKNVYNVVYTEMMWKAVPEGTSILSRAKSTGNLKMCEDYVTALFCANATGCHKLPVLIIGNVPETHSLYNFKSKSFSTIYKSDPNACMNSTTFIQWYTEHFLESIKKRQEKCHREKSLLLLDNATLLYNVADLNKIDPFVTVKSPPLSLSTLLQPMNCGVITSFKRKYRIEFLETITPLPTCNTENEVIYLHKKLSMWDCCRIVHDAWLNVEHAILIYSWDCLLRPRIVRSMKNTECVADELKALELLHDLPGCDLCKRTNVLNWFHIDDGRDVIMRICTEEVLQEFKNNTPHRVITDITDEQAGPSHS